MRKQRFDFVFNLDDPSHARAFEIFKNWPPRRRGESIIQAILKQDDMASIQQIVSGTIRETLISMGAHTRAVELPKSISPKPAPPPYPEKQDSVKHDAIQEAGTLPDDQVPDDQLTRLLELGVGG